MLSTLAISRYACAAQISFNSPSSDLMKSPIPELVKRERQDLSSYLWHLCRQDNNPSAALSSILRQKSINASRDRDTQENVVCFTEAPLEQIRQQSKSLRQARFPRFSLTGIGFKKTYVFAKGGLPAIYQPRKFLSILPPELRWRHVDLDLSNKKRVDYTWQREWRVKSDLAFSGEENEAIVVVPAVDQFEGEIYAIEADGDWIDGQPETFPSFVVHWNFISLDCLNDPIDDHQVEVAGRQRSGSYDCP